MEYNYELIYSMLHCIQIIVRKTFQLSQNLNYKLVLRASRVGVPVIHCFQC